jgi:hypothetical protein
LVLTILVTVVGASITSHFNYYYCLLVRFLFSSICMSNHEPYHHKCNHSLPCLNLCCRFPSLGIPREEPISCSHIASHMCTAQSFCCFILWAELMVISPLALPVSQPSQFFIDLSISVSLLRLLALWRQKMYLIYFGF